MMFHLNMSLLGITFLAIQTFSIGYVAATSRITWNFECGCLQGWKLQGNAFQWQPTLNDNPAARNREPSNHQGNYWIGGAQNYTSTLYIPGAGAGDQPIGTMESQPFALYANKISFLVGGGCYSNVGFQLIFQGSAVRTSRGTCYETMSRKEWNVSQFFGKTLSIRAYDNSTSSWGHINFDDIKFFN